MSDYTGPYGLADGVAKEHQGLPVAGYRPQSQANVDMVNANKLVEEHMLMNLDVLKTKDVDQRWLAIARTHFEQGFMALNRSIFKPERLKVELK
jgi:hypothetical protein